MRDTKKRHAKRVRLSGITNQRVYSLRKRYGISEAEYIALVASHNNACGICLAPLPSAVFVDHAHETGAIRGVLCRPCNFAIGLMDDDPVRLRAAAAYIERAAAVTVVDSIKTPPCGNKACESNKLVDRVTQTI